MLFDAAASAMIKEIHPEMVLAQRGQLLQSAVAACVSAGQAGAVHSLLQISSVDTYLEDQGGRWSHVLAEGLIRGALGAHGKDAANRVWEFITTDSG
jgi:hypothetical protein